MYNHERFIPMSIIEVKDVSDNVARHGALMLMAIRAVVQHRARARRRDRQDRALPGLQPHHGAP